jgi:mannan endo-1,4-beta-mannosidase
MLGAFHVGNSETQEYFLSPIHFPEGETELTFALLRGAVFVNKVTAENVPPIARERFGLAEGAALVTPDPSAAATAMFNYFGFIFGQKILTAQYCTVNTNAEIDAVYKSTRRRPAIRFVELEGVDGHEREIELMKQWHEKGGIVGITWLPEREPELENDEEFLDDISAIAQTLTELSRADIPVLWNPLPDGGSPLHWWGQHGGERYIELWHTVYNQLINYHGLTNLIWLWSGGSYLYYPGDNRADIIGESIFTGNKGAINGSHAVRLANTERYGFNSRSKPAMVSASSGLPLPDILARDNAAWLVWTLYKGDFVIDNSGNVLEEAEQMLDRFYNHELTVCLDGLPSFGD